ncbi:ABC transporter ATP-binding protein [Thermanaerothrix sp.]|uniref:ABC transporter ATP-binding protein n=1 Tax=Thermanaerothrix sp. TaxID=2972675 RepID=UPI002ADE8800|nr:ABC transporter ATP-binding protein [Thermanaerothrix sp.]
MVNNEIAYRRPKPSSSAGGEIRPTGGVMRRALRYLSRYRTQALLPYVFLTIATLAQLAVPRMVRNMIDAVTRGAIADQVLKALERIPATFINQALPRILDVLNYPTTWNLQQLRDRLSQDVSNAPGDLMRAAVAILVFAIVRGLFAFLQSYWAERNSQAVAFDLRNELYAKIQRLSFSYHDRQQTGQLMVRATDDVEKLRLFLGQGLLQLVGAVILLTGTLILLFSTNPGLALTTLWILPVALILFAIFSRISRPMFTRVQQRLSELNTILQENLAGIKVIKAFVREREEQAKFRMAADRLMHQQIAIARLFTFLFPFAFLIANLGQATILYAGGQRIIQGLLTLGEWQEFSLYLVFLFLPIAQFGFIINQFSQASASAVRIFEILDAQSEVVEKPNAVVLPPIQGHVKFENVSFRYFGSGEPVLRNVSFEVQPGQTVALLGATGSGKTTIINLIPRFYDPTEGRILIDGYDIRDVTLQSLRSQIGIVLQETTLFSGTIRENIAFGKPDATMDEIIAAAKAAAAHDFIMSFPQGYDTMVGERGTTLSGGQKQRIALARALLLNPRILILDEATSNVDVATEAQIQSALQELMKGRTSFVIAQRISTVMNADLILVLDRGQIVAQGRHEDLLEESEIYAEIYSSQLLDDEAQFTADAVILPGD